MVVEPGVPPAVEVVPPGDEVAGDSVEDAVDEAVVVFAEDPEGGVGTTLQG